MDIKIIKRIHLNIFDQTKLRTVVGPVDAHFDFYPFVGWWSHVGRGGCQFFFIMLFSYFIIYIYIYILKIF